MKSLILLSVLAVTTNLAVAKKSMPSKEEIKNRIVTLSMSSDEPFRQYPQPGNWVAKIDEGFQEDTWIEYSRTERTYDDADSVLSEIYYYSDSDESESAFIYQFVRNNGRLVRKDIVIDMGNNQFFKTGEEEYTYNGNLLVAKTTWVVLLGTREKSYEVTYEYDANNRLSRINDPDFRQEFTWYESGSMQSWTKYVLQDGEWKKDDKYTYNWSESGQLISETRYWGYWEMGDDWTLWEKREFQYLPSGQIDIIHIYIWNLLDAVWDFGMAEDYFYRDGLLNRISSYSGPSPDDLVKWNDDTFSYDENNRLTSSTAWMKGEDQELMIPTNRTVYEYATETGTNDEETAPTFTLGQNYPNPFNPVTVVPFSLAKTSAVSLKIFDLLGREVQSMNLGTRPAGNNEVSIDASGLPSGYYLYQISTNGQKLTRRMAVLK